MISGYAPLTSAVRDMLARTDISDTAFDVFITVVEEEICAAIQPRELDTVAVLAPKLEEGETELDTSSVKLPDDFRLGRYVLANDTTFMQINSRMFMESNVGNVFTIIGDRLHLGSAYQGGPVKLLYSKRIPHLDKTTNLTNEIINRYPTLYLYGCLREACKYIDDKAKEQRYATAFDVALEAAGVDADQSRFSGSELVYSSGFVTGGA